MKWIGRLLYIAIVVLFTFNVGFGDGIIHSEYWGDVIVSDLEDVDHTMSAFLGTRLAYYQRDELNTIDFSTTTNNGIDFDVTIDIYPIGSSRTDFENNRIYDGIGLILKDLTVSEEFNLEYFTFKFKLYDIVNDRVVDLYLTPEAAGESYYIFYMTPLNTEVVSGFPPGMLFFSEYDFKIHDPNILESDMDSVKAEYQIVTIDMFAHGYLVEDKTGKDQNYHLFKGYSDTTYVGDGNALVINNSFEIVREDYFISKLIPAELPTEDDMNAFNLGYLKPNYAKYNYWYWIVGFLYLSLLVIIPYFWFFHRKVMDNMRLRKKIRLKAEQRKQATIVEAKYTNKK